MAVWNDILNSMIDKNSALDETLFLWLRDNQIWLRDQLGQGVFGDGSDGAGSYPSGTTDLTKPHYQFTTLNIAGGAVLRSQRGFGIIRVQGDFTLNGQLRAWDVDGGSATSALEGVGSVGFGLMDPDNLSRDAVTGVPIEGGGAASGGIAAGGGGGGMWGNGGIGAVSTGTPGAAGLCNWRRKDLEFPGQDWFGLNPAYWLYSRPGGGGEGTNGVDGGDPGGVLIVLVGGDITGTGDLDAFGTNGVSDFGGGGGGGGGAIWCGVSGDISAISIDASGGNGPGSTVLGGEGGGGRIVLLYGGSNSSTTDVTHGTGNGAGEDGLVTTANVDPIERWY